MHFSTILLASGLASVTTAIPGLLGLGARGADPYSSSYKYNGAQNALPGAGQQQLVPAPGDPNHQYKAPGPGDLRGPCPGLNALANHGFLSRNGLTSWTELIDAQQNAFNVGYDLAVFLTTIGVAACGDSVTGLLSLGPDQTSRTSVLGLGLSGPEPGLNGHNKFESDVSLTRNDQWPSGDNWRFNSSLWDQLVQTCPQGANFDCLSKHRVIRYNYSLKNNKQFYYGQKQILMYGATAFIYKLWGADSGVVDPTTLASLFGATKDANGKTQYQPERFPAGFKSRSQPYGLVEATLEGLKLYLANPVMFGSATGNGGFDGLNVDAFQNGYLSPAISVNQIMCTMYELAIEDSPGIVGSVLQTTLQALNFITTKINPLFKSYGCDLVTYS